MAAWLLVGLVGALACYAVWQPGGACARHALCTRCAHPPTHHNHHPPTHPPLPHPLALLSPCRGPPARELLTTAQAILLLLVLLVQLLTLYDNVVLRRQLAAAPALPHC